MRTFRHTHVMVSTLLLAGWSMTAWSFANVAVGDKLQNLKMPTLEGREHPLLAQKKANVFLFFRPDQEHCREVLKEVAKLEQELAGKPVHWVAIVADTFAAEEISSAVKDANVGFPVLLDKDNALYGKLGVILLPTLGIADEKDILTAYLHYTKVNIIEMLRAHVLHQLGELSDAQLAQVKNPTKTPVGGNDSKAQRTLRMAQMLFKAGKLDKALETALQSIEQDPKLVEAHAIVGQIHAAMGDCTKALAAFDEALQLDPAEPIAMEGKKDCQH